MSNKVLSEKSIAGKPNGKSPLKNTSKALPNSSLKVGKPSYSKANNFNELGMLLREAEFLLYTNNQPVSERIKTFRGIYYGTKWSYEYKKLGSGIRNVLFDNYLTGNLMGAADPKPMIGDELYLALFNTPEVKDKNYIIDIGHLLIGLDARNSIASINLPTPFGGTGLEFATWLGDLGGGCGKLAKRRVKAPNTPAIKMFRGSDFGASPNIEGDIAGYLIARDVNSESVTSVQLADEAFVADAIIRYLPLKGQYSEEWKNRFIVFVKMLGGKVNSNKEITNLAELSASLSDKILSCGIDINSWRRHINQHKFH